ncbi:predicted protein [Naegleria gruberi]|uniref:Predicted protein n=1 Tax=Naegleria gruberi TaxID=5762 RepID=D2UXI2_NAEGR|nr:uncharacterized protein NAEGRDRAFT_61133 [Naegleria gruberi]EFC50290.1 predicted protein [Naegleria gruberi]|eukprot:XP_002683034.1 predicted protein [Naegleria gruberi strain NEG-M]
MTKSGWKANPDFFKQQQNNNDIQVFVGKRPTTSNIASSSTKIQQVSTRPSTSIQPEETKLSSRLLSNKSKPRKEPIPPQQESLYEMTKYLNKQTRDIYNNEDSFQLDDSDSRLFKPARQHTLHMDDLEDSFNESDTQEQEDEYDPRSPQSIHESPIKKPLPSHRRSLSARMLPNMGRGFATTKREESEEDSPIKEQLREEVIPKRKAPRYPSSLLNKNTNSEQVMEEITPSNAQLRKSQEEITKLSGESLIGNEATTSFTGTSTNTNAREASHYDYAARDQNLQRTQNLQNNRYQQPEISKEHAIVDTPKQSATTAKVMSIINRESPKERQYNRNKIMGTSYSLTPFALDDNISSLQTANIDEQLMQLSLEKTRLEGDMQKLFSMGIKSIAAKKQKMSLELRLEEIEKQSSQLKMRLRNMNY